MNPYEIKDINEREKILTDLCEADREDLLAQERLAILKKRYAPVVGKNAVRPDLFMQAWMNIHIESRESSFLFSKKSRTKHLVNYLKALWILRDDGAVNEPVSQALKDEWADFAERLVDTYLKDGNFDRVVFGMMKMPESKLQKKIETEIDTVTKDYPAHLGFEIACRPFREVVLTVYRRRVGLEV